jgi:Fe-S-cluster-containing dehydrogenase component
MPERFVFDQDLCTGCHACMVACQIENGVTPPRSWRRVHTFNDRNHPGLPRTHLSLACNHCSEPSCAANCPALALSRNAETGIVTLDKTKCIGCRYCSWSCPYDAPRFNEAEGVMEKCTFCDHRLSEGFQPACVSACPTGALGCEDMDAASAGAASADAASGDAPPVHGFPRSDLEPAIRFEKPTRVSVRPEMTAVSPGDVVEEEFAAVREPAPQRITLRSEWTLAVFTMAASILAGLAASSAAGALSVEPAAFLGAGFGAMILSAVHLGKKVRSGRANLNWRSSALTREIGLYALFMGLAALHLLVLRESSFAGWAAAAAGFCTLVAIDGVYDAVPGREPTGPHSARALGSGLLFAGAFSGLVPLWGGIAFIKAVLYARRKVGFARGGMATRPFLGILRVGGGFLAPAVLLLIDAEGLYRNAVACAVLGEAIDRWEFYLEFTAPSPARQMNADLDRELRAAGE